MPLSQLIAAKRVRFDLDGFGAREYSQWLAPKAAWLVFDNDKTGVIDSGIKLVGQSSFWIFWQDGYEVMRGLDDNHDGMLSGTELNGIALWQDLNSNGKSEPGEVKSLSSFGIVSLSVNAMRNSDGILASKQGVCLRDGSTLPSYDIVLSTDNAHAKSQKQTNILPGARVKPSSALFF